MQIPFSSSDSITLATSIYIYIYIYIPQNMPVVRGQQCCKVVCFVICVVNRVQSNEASCIIFTWTSCCCPGVFQTMVWRILYYAVSV